jgi:hypothetical protein
MLRDLEAGRRRLYQAPTVRDWSVCRFHGERGGGSSGAVNGAYRYMQRFTISEKTVEIHRANVMRKMQARSLASLVHMAVSLRDD